jgi:hypothetical protein
MQRRTFCFLQVALGLLTTSLVLPTGLLAQHGGLAAPMSSAHVGGVVHSSPSFAGATRTFVPPAGPLFQGQSARHPSSPAGRSGHWPSWDAGRHPENSRHGLGYRPGFYVGYPWLAPFGYGLPNALPYGDDQDEGGGAQPAPQQADYSNQPPSDYGPEPPEVAANTPSPFRPPYEGQIEAAPVNLQPTTTLIFKDRRAPLQVHNYALTASTLYALDGDSRQEIPLSLLDVPATVEANRKAGVDFALPVSR